MANNIRESYFFSPGLSGWRIFRFFLLLLAAGLLLAAPPRVLATSKSWTNTTLATGTWNRSANWSPSGVPTINDQLVIDNSGTALVPTGVSGTYDSLSLGSVSGKSGNLNISGGFLTNADSSFLQTTGIGEHGVGQAIMTSGSWQAGSLSIGYSGTGTLNLSGGLLNSDGLGSIGTNSGAVGAVIVSGGTWASESGYAVGGAGAGTLTLSGSGVVTLTSAGILNLARSGGSAGTLNLGSGTKAGTLTASEVRAGSGTAIVNFNQSGSYAFAPRLRGNMTLNVIGTGTTLLTGSNDYHGNTVITNGMLLIVGDDSGISGTTTVQSGATFGGSGTMGGDVLVQTGGTLSPGQSPGLLSITGALTMNSTSTLEMQITGTTAGLYDQLSVGGNFAAAGTLDLNVSYAVAWGDSFQIFTSGGFDSGSFTILTNLTGGLSWDDSQLASTGFVTIVPEPGTSALAMLGLGLGFAAWRGRARSLWPRQGESPN